MVRWFVEPNVVGGWDIRSEGDLTHTVRTSTRADAEAAARRLAQQSGGQIVVVNTNYETLASYQVAPLAQRKREQKLGPELTPPPTADVTPPPTVAATPSLPPIHKTPPTSREQRDVGETLEAIGKIAEGKKKSDEADEAGLADAMKKVLINKSDQVLDAGFQSWWKRVDANQRFAARALIAAALIGPIGATVITIGQSIVNPKFSTEIFVALLWLAFLTLPVVTAGVVAVLIMGRANLAVGLLVVAGVTLAAAWFVGEVGAPTSLGELYCYADISSGGVVYENECRSMDTQGYIDRSAPGLSPSTSPSIILGAFAVVADARGVLMALCGVVAGVAGGYLARRAT